MGILETIEPMLAEPLKYDVHLPHKIKERLN